MLKAATISCAFVLFASSVRADVALVLQCTPLVTAPTSNATDSITTINISVQNKAWRVTHISARGANYERTAQYHFRDTTASGLPSWEGTGVRLKNIKMSGEISLKDGQYAYVERAYDANLRGKQVYDMVASCVSLTQPPQLQPSAAPVRPGNTIPPESAIPNQGCRSIADKEERLKCYDNAGQHPPQPSNNSQTPVVSEHAEKSLGPLPSAPCPEYLVSKYVSQSWLNKSVTLTEIAECAHTSVSNLSAYLYAMAQVTGDDSGKDLVQSLVNFSRKIILASAAAEACFRAMGMQPKDDRGDWKDSLDLIRDFAEKSGSARRSALEICAPLELL